MKIDDYLKQSYLGIVSDISDVYTLLQKNPNILIWANKNGFTYNDIIIGIYGSLIVDTFYCELTSFDSKGIYYVTHTNVFNARLFYYRFKKEFDYIKQLFKDRYVDYIVLYNCEVNIQVEDVGPQVHRLWLFI